MPTSAAQTLAGEKGPETDRLAFFSRPLERKLSLRTELDIQRSVLGKRKQWCQRKGRAERQCKHTHTRKEVKAHAKGSEGVEENSGVGEL